VSFDRLAPHYDWMVAVTAGGLLQRAQRRNEGVGDGIRWIHADVHAWEPDGQHDAIVTCFFLGCFPRGEADHVVARLAAAAAPEAARLVVDFALPAAGPARWRAQAVPG
jgi:hypothetical protein